MSSDHLRVIELFGGIGACSKALERTGIAYDIADYVEIDKYAVASFNALHGTNFEPQDIRNWDKNIQADLIMHGSPCQDFSIAGKQAGGDENSGTRSSLMYETLRIVEKVKPKYVVWENVKNLLSKKHRHNFDAYLKHMEGLGYTNYYQVLNAKDYGVPQNRERVFTISILGGGDFNFPEKQPLTKRLRDILEIEVNEKYYLSEEQTKRLRESMFNQQKARENTPGSIVPTLCARDYKDPQCVRVGGLYDTKNNKHQAGSVYNPEGIAATLSTMQGGNQEPIILEDPFCVACRGREAQALHTVRTEYGKEIRKDYETGKIQAKRSTIQQLEPRTDGITNTITTVQKDNYIAIKTANSQGYDLAKDGDGVDLSYPNSTTRRGRVGHGVAKTITTNDSQGVLNGYKIRKLTPKECWRLMGFDDADFEKAAKVNSNTQLYKQAGNSIVVNVLEAIFHNLLIEKGVAKVEETKRVPIITNYEVANALEAFNQAKQGAEAAGCKLVGEFEYRGENITIRLQAS